MHYLFLLLCCIPLGLSAQTITLSEEVAMRNDTEYLPLGEISGQMLMLVDYRNKVEVHGYTPDLKIAWTKELELKKRQPRIVQVVADQDHFSILYRFRRKGNTYLQLDRYDAAANLRDSTTVVDYGSLFFTPHLEVVQSQDLSKLGIYYLERNTRVHAAVIDLHQPGTQWELTFEPTYFSYGEHFVGATVSNAGELYFILERNNFRSRRRDHVFEVHRIHSGGTYQTFNLQVNEMVTFDVKYDYDNVNDRLTAVGLYSERSNSRADGHFYLSTVPDVAGSFIYERMPFSDQLVSLILDKKVKDNKGLTELIVQDIKLRRDGGALLVCERNRQFERNRGMNNRQFMDARGRLFTDFYYEEVVVYAYHPDGSLHWKNILAKQQYSQDDDGVFSSYFLFETPSQLRFIFNDEVKLENTVSEYVVTSRGAFDRNSLLSTADLDLRIQFRDAVQIDGNELVAPSQYRNKLRLVKFEF